MFRYCIISFQVYLHSDVCAKSFTNTISPINTFSGVLVQQTHFNKSCCAHISLLSTSKALQKHHMSSSPQDLDPKQLTQSNLTKTTLKSPHSIFQLCLVGSTPHSIDVWSGPSVQTSPSAARSTVAGVHFALLLPVSSDVPKRSKILLNLRAMM